MTNGFVGFTRFVMVVCVCFVACGCSNKTGGWKTRGGWTFQQKSSSDVEDLAERFGMNQPPATEETVVSDDTEAKQAREDVLAFIERLEPEKPQELKRADDGERRKPYHRDGRKVYPIKAQSFTGEDENDDHQNQSRRNDGDPVEKEMLQAMNDGGANEPSTVISPNVALSVDDLVEPIREPRITKVSFKVPDPVQPLPMVSDEPTTNRSMAKVTLQVNATLADYIEELVKLTQEEPTNAEARWRLALLYAATGDDEKATGLFDELPEDMASMMTEAMELLSGLRLMAVSPVRGADDAYAAADRLRSAVATKASLEIPAVKLCSRVQAFAVYEELPADVFRPGRANQAILYFEVENFKSQAESNGRYRSLLSSHVEIMSPSGDVLWQNDEPRIEDSARRVRRDFFVAQRIVIPATLGDGEYVLKLTVEDKLAGKRTQAVHPFSVGDTRLSSAGAGR